MNPVQQERRIVIAPKGAPAGTEVTVTMTGMPPLTGLQIGFGSLQEHQFIARTPSDENGNATHVVRLPDWAQRDKVHFFFIAWGDIRPRGFSDAFHVTGPESVARVAGLLGREGESACTTLRDGADNLYSLIGDTSSFPPGARVVVRGPVVDGTPCSGLGITISVTEIRSSL